MGATVELMENGSVENVPGVKAVPLHFSDLRLMRYCGRQKDSIINGHALSPTMGKK